MIGLLIEIKDKALHVLAPVEVCSKWSKFKKEKNISFTKDFFIGYIIENKCIFFRNNSVVFLNRCRVGGTFTCIRADKFLTVYFPSQFLAAPACH